VVVLNQGDNKMKKILVVVYLFSLVLFSLAQTKNQYYVQAYPAIGWDSLRAIIEKAENYPTNLIVRDIMGSIPVYIMIDSSGILTKVISAYDNSNSSNPDSITHREFILAIENILKPVKWHPSMQNNIPINDKVYKTFNFLLLGDKESEFNILAPKIYIK
jgi:hypothetical protein